MRANKYLYHVQLDDGVHYVIFNGFNKEFLILVEKALPSMMELINLMIIQVLTLKYYKD